MSKVSLTQLRNLAKGKIMPVELGLEFKQYLPMLNKRVIAEDVELYTVEENNSVHYLDLFWFDLSLGLQIVKNYTNVDFSYLEKADREVLSDKTMEFYDLLEQTGVIDMVYEEVADARRLRVYVEHHIQNVLKEKNSLTSSVARFLENMPDMAEMEKIMKQVGSMDTSKLDYIKNILKYNAGENGAD